MNRFRALGTRSRLLVAFVAAGAAFGVVSIVQASIPGPGGVVHSCYRQGNGQLRVIDTAAGGACKSNEKPLNLNQTGTTGPGGPTGATGATGPVGSPEYAYIFDLSPGDLPATVPVGGDVPFAQNGPMTAGISYLANGRITIGTAGVYRVEFIASVDEAGQLELTKNGVELPATVYGRATGTSEISGQAVLTVAAADVLTLRNPSGNATALTFTPLAGGTHADVAASIVIEQLS